MPLHWTVMDLRDWREVAIGLINFFGIYKGEKLEGAWLRMRVTGIESQSI